MTDALQFSYSRHPVQFKYQNSRYYLHKPPTPHTTKRTISVCDLPFLTPPLNTALSRTLKYQNSRYYLHKQLLPHTTKRTISVCDLPFLTPLSILHCHAQSSTRSPVTISTNHRPHTEPNAPFQSVTCQSLHPSQYCTLTHTQVPEDSLLSSQTAGCHAAPNAPFQSVTCHSLRPILILHSHANSSLATDRFSFCPPKFCTQFSYIKCVLHALPIPHFILSP